MTSPASTREQMLTVTLGLDRSGGPVEAHLIAQRPHMRWVGDYGMGKTEQLRSAVGQLAQQIPASAGLLRMILFSANAVANSFPDMDNAEGVLVITPSDFEGSIARFASEVYQRQSDPQAPPLVIAVDDLGWWRTHCRPLVPLVEHLPSDRRYPSDARGLGQIHLLLASSRIGDFYADPMDFFWHPNPFTTVLLPLDRHDERKYASMVEPLHSLLGPVQRPYPGRPQCPRSAYRTTSGSVTKFDLAPV
jgi:hypothetical protein